MNGKYLLMTGAPGSRWSGVANNIWISEDFDQTDSDTTREYRHHSNVHGSLYHSGAYFDPLMEFKFDKKEWDLPFSGEGVKLIKSHTLSTQLPNYHKYPIVMVIRNSYSCWEWWNECGGFDIKYPDYKWYKNQDNMFVQIQLQNQAITTFIYKNRDKVTQCYNNLEVLNTLGLSEVFAKDEYGKKDVSVYVYQP